MVELLVASTLALVTMGAVATLFGLFSRTFSDSQTMIDLSARMRSAAWRLRQDLEGLTCSVQPWNRPEANAGYLEIVEGPKVDATAANGTPNIVADVDDVLMLTTTSVTQPFTGILTGALGLESQTAEVAWFCKPAATTINGVQLYNLYRRQLLVSAAPGTGSFQVPNSVAFTSWDALYAANDLSCRRDGSNLVPNTLGDLTKRENRFLHNPSGTVDASTFPYSGTVSQTPTSVNGDILSGSRAGEDLLLTNVIAFDIQVFNPSSLTATDAYIDLGGGLPATGTLAGAANARSKLATPTYDTWSVHYENNGIDEDNDSIPDEGSNDADDNGNGVKDELAEFETAPPYAVTLRGVRVRIRCYEPVSKQVRQITVLHSFTN